MHENNPLSMDVNEKILLIDKFLNGLGVNLSCGTVPEMIDGFKKFPQRQSDKELKYRIIEGELEKLKLVEKIRGGDNSVINGYLIFKLTPLGFELVESKRSVSELYQQIQTDKSLETRLKEYSLEKLEYEKTIREQEKRIRNLSERLKILSLIQKYWWLIMTFLGLGILLGKLIHM